MQNLVIRVPPKMREDLEAKGKSKAQWIRDVLRKALDNEV